MTNLLNKLYTENYLNKEELTELLKESIKTPNPLLERANQTTELYYGKRVFLRGLIEFSNFCKQNCQYCGIRKGNAKVERYRLTPAQIYDCCQQGYNLGYRTFVLQSGEDPYFTDDRLVEIIKFIRSTYTDAAISLSIGERSYDSYQKLHEAGANRFLLRHETANKQLYNRFHPQMSNQNRRQCLLDLRKAKFHIGAGFLVGLPNQTLNDLVDDLIFLKQLEPEMVGLGPFIPHPDTPLGTYPAGSIDLTIIMLAFTRLLLPKALIPATTAVGTLSGEGRIKALLSGANVVMPNLTPSSAKLKYELYKDKAGIRDDSLTALNNMKKIIERTGLVPDLGRGDPILRER